MSDYPDPAVGTGVAEHDHLPGQVFFALSRDPSISVRYAVARNLTTPIKILEQLCEDENPYVVSRAAMTLATISQAAKSQSNVVKLNFKENFKAQNISQKMKTLDKDELSKNSKVRNIAAF
jgi:hypothetical protein